MLTNICYYCYRTVYETLLICYNSFLKLIVDVERHCEARVSKYTTLKWKSYFKSTIECFYKTDCFLTKRFEVLNAKHILYTFMNKTQNVLCSKEFLLNKR